MPSPIETYLPVPEGFQAFEKIVCTCANLRWDTKDFRLHARTGQGQYGVDVYGHDKENRFIAYQCKNMPDGISMATIRDEIAKAEEFKPAIEHFCIATSAKKDGAVEREVLQLSKQRKEQSKFTVDVLFWPDLQDLLCQSQDALHAHYGGFGLDALGGPDARLVKDRARFDQLQAALPHTLVLQFAEHDFRHPFPYKPVTRLHEFLHGWRTIATAFYDETLREAFSGLYNACDTLSEELGDRTSLCGKAADRIWVVHEQFRDRPNADDLADAAELDKLAAQFARVYDDYLTLCRTTLYP
ncbi:hypothetical protein [Burkholderia gladioli]|uniref:hypothetical protein n=1 Tax=Burkholderia gladioli TaxID=28095 RepID=UPI00164230B8|nr:hypothetical protein [Burkholderia gladioli]